MNLQDLVEEKAQLDARVNSLKDFCKTPTLMTLPLEHRVLIAEQAHHMDEYARILSARIDSFPPQ